jgi:hypothetical protein
VPSLGMTLTWLTYGRRQALPPGGIGLCALCSVSCGLSTTPPQLLLCVPWWEGDSSPITESPSSEPGPPPLPHLLFLNLASSCPSPPSAERLRPDVQVSGTRLICQARHGQQLPGEGGPMYNHADFFSVKHKRFSF